MKLNLRKLVLGVAIASLPQLMNAQEVTLTGMPEDGMVYDATIGTVNNPYINDVAQSGFEGMKLVASDIGGGICLLSNILVFEIPEIPAGKVVVDAELSVNVAWGREWISGSIDLYGLPFSAATTLDASMHYNGAFSVDQNGGMGIQDEYFTKTNPGAIDPERVVPTSAGASEALSSYINTQLVGGAVQGNYLFFRLSPDEVATANYHFYIVSSGNNVDEAKRPSLKITFGDPDILPPTVAAVNDTKIPNIVEVVFNESVEKMSAEVASNYVISPAVNVVSATLASDLKTVTLTTGDVVVGNSYVVTATGVKDLSGNTAPTSGNYTAVDYTLYADASGFQDPNFPDNAFDNSDATKWTVDGLTSWLVRSFGEVKAIESIAIKFPGMEGRVYNFSVDVSMDGITYSSALASQTSVEQASGTAVEQTFDFPSTMNARFVRINANGNVTNSAVSVWNNYTEVSFIEGTLANAKTERQVLDIYPNPVTNGEFTVSTVGMKGAVEMTIYNVTGKMVYSKSINAAAKKATVNANLSQGLYIVKLTDGTSAKTQKITVQ